MDLSYDKPPPDFSVRSAQKEALLKMVKLNPENDEDDSGGKGFTWKILIFDERASDIVAPLIHVGELRREGVTLHKKIKQLRSQVEDVDAVYFVAPTGENLKLIVEDLKKSFYGGFHLNFYSSLTESQITELASASVELGASDLIKEVVEQQCNFLAYADRMFSLDIPRCYSKLFSPVPLPEVEPSAIAKGLFDVCSTMGVIPYLCSRDCNPIVEALIKLLRDNCNSGGFTHSGGQRPLLIIFNRSEDMRPMLQHPWTYEAMVHDTLGMRLNRVKVEVEEKTPSGEMKVQTMSFDLDPSHDGFWFEHRTSQFPHMAAAAHEKLEEYRKAKDTVSKFGGSSDTDPMAGFGQTDEIKSVMDNMPELREKKKSIDMHINIATALLSQIKRRELNVFATLEDAIISGATGVKNQVIAILKDPARGTDMDKLRLVLVYYLSVPNMTDEQTAELEAALPTSVPRGAFHVLKQQKMNNELTQRNTRPDRSGRAAASNAIMQKGFDGFQSVFSYVQSGVGSVVGAQSKDFPITQFTQEAMCLRREDFQYFDPVTGSSSAARPTQAFQDAIVFVVGGGSYVEYSNMQQAASKSVPVKRIIYGATNICTSEEFLQEVGDMDKRG